MQKQYEAAIVDGAGGFQRISFEAGEAEVLLFLFLLKENFLPSLLQNLILNRISS
ncbi:hypothetical protein [Niallia circulans]|uniref:hypothetical protein n=1 Tax=Niallia circulans TaxID=1397 RepID=UPI0015959C9F|nr:hypothetical protein [Niallia circulans]